MQIVAKSRKFYLHKKYLAALILEHIREIMVDTCNLTLCDSCTSADVSKIILVHTTVCGSESLTKLHPKPIPTSSLVVMS